MLDFRIDTFLTVCQYMSYTKAAKALHITQPAVSQHIHYLEDLYQTKLFFYEGRKIQLTKAGTFLLQAATTLKNDESFLQERLLHSETTEFSLRFGTTMTIGEFVISNPLSDYIQKHPDSRIHMVLSNTQDLLLRLRSGEIHFALVEGYYDNEEFESLSYRTEPFLPICSSDHCFKKKPAYLQDLLSERLIVRESGSGTRSILEKNLDLQNIRLSDFSHLTEIGSMHVILDLIAKDLGITFLYQTAANLGLSNGTYATIPLKDFHMEHDFTFIWNRGSIYRDVYRDICTELKNT